MRPNFSGQKFNCSGDQIFDGVNILIYQLSITQHFLGFKVVEGFLGNQHFWEAIILESKIFGGS